MKKQNIEHILELIELIKIEAKDRCAQVSSINKILYKITNAIKDNQKEIQRIKDLLGR